MIALLVGLLMVGAFAWWEGGRYPRAVQWGRQVLRAAAPPARAELIAAISDQLDRAYAKHGRGQWGRHEFYGILKEEVDELWDNIKADKPLEDVRDEALQVAAMCIRYLETGDRYGFA